MFPLQGLVAIRPAQCGSEPRHTLTRLWIHENMRVYHDRLINEEDKEMFKQMIYEMLKSRFELRDDYHDVFVSRTIMFGDYLKPGALPEERVYEEVQDQGKLLVLLESYLEDYNADNVPMNLVFFEDAIQHVSRIARILRQPRGNALLVGVGGSGKSSLTRFASYLSDTQCFSIELVRGYGVTEFREDLRKLFWACGVEGRKICFLISESHLVNEAFVEDIDLILNNGEITGLFAPDDKERILSELLPWGTANGVQDGRDQLWRAFINRVRDNLHVVLCLSPVGETFRSRCRMFPSLINCTTTDW